MKLQRLLSFIGLTMALCLASAFLAHDAGAVTRPYNYGLTQKLSECSGPGRFNVRLTWTPVADSSTYYVASGNKCQLRNAVCGTAGGCGAFTCTGPGPCVMELSQCQQGRGGSWARIASPGRYQNVSISGPRLCK